MSLASNKFKQQLKAAKPQIGLWSSLCNNLSAEVTAWAGFDWVLIDMEHSPNDLQLVLAQLQVYAASETSVLVRPQWNDPILIKRLMDLGVPGLLIPMVQTREEAELAVAATRYPPQGIRGFTGMSRANKFGRVPNYIESVDHETAVIVQIETQLALQNAEEIAATQGLSAVFFGPSDIAADMGLVGNALHQDVWNKIMPIAETLIAKGVRVGSYVTDQGFAAELLNKGFHFVACGSDVALLAKAADQLCADLKAAVNTK